MLFETELNVNLDRIRRTLLAGAYRPGGYRTFQIREPKARTVRSLPYHDRVVQHALCDGGLAAYLDKKLIYDAAACRVGKGTHFALERLKGFFRKHWNCHGAEGWILKTDIAKFFDSVDHRVLKEILYPSVCDKRVRSMLDAILDEGRAKGLPPGNMTSQWFANLYLNPLDRFVKVELKIRHYVRYMDDGVALHLDREYLRHCLEEIRNFVEARLKLKLNAKSQIMPLRNGVDFLGFRTYITETGKVIRKVRHESAKRMKRKLKAFQQKYSRGEMSMEEIERSLYSWLGHAEFGDTYALRKSMLEEAIFSRRSEDDDA